MTTVQGARNHWCREYVAESSQLGISRLRERVTIGVASAGKVKGVLSKSLFAPSVYPQNGIISDLL